MSRKEAYVSFETAKLLKEKGFDIPVGGWYVNKDDNFTWADSFEFLDHYDDYIPTCTQQMACRWLREEKGFYVYANYGCYHTLNEEYWIPEIGSMRDFDIPDDFYKEYNSPEDAVEAALKYVLTNLI